KSCAVVVAAQYRPFDQFAGSRIVDRLLFLGCLGGFALSRERNGLPDRCDVRRSGRKGGLVFCNGDVAQGGNDHIFAATVLAGLLCFCRRLCVGRKPRRKGAGQGTEQDEAKRHSENDCSSCLISHRGFSQESWRKVCRELLSAYLFD